MEIPRRPLGKTGEEVSIIGVGGYHVGLASVPEAEAVRLIRAAVDAGVTFLDNNTGYHEGRSEERMGRALRDGYRDRVFLMTKFESRDRAGALRELDDSLRRLGTDHLDLWQLHEVVYETDPDLASAPGGALEALDEAKRAGKVRFVGFTGHKDPAIHLRMLDLFTFDTVQLPLNVMDAHFRSFERLVLPRLVEQQVGVIGMKSFGDGEIVRSGVVTPEEALAYALSLPVSTVVKGMESRRDLDTNLGVARGFHPLGAGDLERIRAKTAPLDVSGDGRYELYKTSMRHDGEVGRRLHGFPPVEEVQY